MAKAAYQEWLLPEGLARLTAWAREGLTNEQVAERLGIVASTLRRWKVRFPQMAEALELGRAEPERPGEAGSPENAADGLVEKALLNRCVGYTVPLKRTYKLKRVEYGENGRKLKEWEELETGVDETHIPADTTAQKYWLGNRLNARWRDKPEAPADGKSLEKAKELLGGVDSAL